MKCVLSFCFSFILVFGSQAQIQIASIEKIGEKGEVLVLTYDIIDSSSDTRYSISLYSSADNYTKSLTLLSGDVGNKLMPGKGKRIEWKAKEELGEFKGKVSFEIRAIVTSLALAVKDFNTGKKFKKGKTYVLNWTGGSPDDLLDLDVYQGDKRISGFTSLTNTGSHAFTIPKDAAVKSDYRIRLKDTKIENRQVFTGSFEVIKPKPKWIFAAPIIVAGAVIWLVTRPTDPEKGIKLPPTPD